MSRSGCEVVRVSELYEFRPEDAYRFANSVGAEAYAKGDELHFKYCPYCHGGKNRDTNTFSISLKNGTWNCKRGSCNQRGGIIRLAQDFEQFSLGDGIDDYYLKRERYRKFLRRPIEVKDGAIEYLKSRGIPAEITRKYEITIKKETDNILVFPFIDEKDDFWFIKYRNITFEKGVTKGNKEWCETGTTKGEKRKPILFGMNHCNFENRTLVMTEGQIDSLSCAAAGIENAVSVPLGKDGFTWVPYCFNFLSRFDELIVFGDYENGEISLLEGMKHRFNGKVFHVRPEDYKDCKDANEILVKYGVEQVRACIEYAVQIPVPGLKPLTEIQRVNLADLDRFETGIKKIDMLCPMIFGELIILTGAAGDGKSTLASQWATLAIDQGYSVMIYSGEMPSWQVKNWIDFQIAGAHNLNDHNDMDIETYKRMTTWNAYSKMFVYDLDDAEDDQENFFKILKDGIQQYGIRFIVIDNMMTAMDYSAGLELNEAQTVFTKKLAKIAQDMSVLILLIVHPRKRLYSGFSNDEIAGSSNIVNRAHKVIRYARPTQEFTDKDGHYWTSSELSDCPIRMLTVSKDRMTGHVINNGIPMYFEELTKRISDTGAFDWRLSWEDKKPEQFEFAEDDIIPF
jgi:archaellum biogenesis ATPase FlaH